MSISKQQQPNKEQVFSQAAAKREKIAKLRLWTLVIWMIGLLLILAKYMRFY